MWGPVAGVRRPCFAIAVGAQIGELFYVAINQYVHHRLCRQGLISRITVAFENRDPRCRTHKREWYGKQYGHVEN